MRPFPIGVSPFRVKGVSYRNFLAYVDEQLPGGRDALIESIADHHLRSFAGQAFLPSSWYDTYPMMDLCAAAGRRLNMPALELAGEVARFGVKRDATGIYRLLLLVTSPDRLLERAANTAKQYFDFVVTDVEKTGRKVYRLTHSGVPGFAIDYCISVGEAFWQEALNLVGASGVEQHWSAPVAMGSKHGLTIFRLERTILWR